MLAALCCAPAAAGPPFRTDDPEPTNYRDWEIYLSGQMENEGATVDGGLPQLELNYGALRNVQVSATLPLAFNSAPGSGTTVGYGATQLGVKLRFIQETAGRPQVAFFPTVVIPSGNAAFGNANSATLLPIWLQKQWGHWLTYGGGGRWFTSGAGNRDSWYSGLVLENVASERLTLGGEIFAQTAQTAGGATTSGFNVGLIAAARGPHRWLFSAGRSLHGSTAFNAYAAYEINLGPHSHAP